MLSSSYSRCLIVYLGQIIYGRNSCEAAIYPTIIFDCFYLFLVERLHNVHVYIMLGLKPICTFLDLLLSLLALEHRE